MNNKLFVGNLSYSTSEDGLRAAFASFGELQYVRVVVDRETGRPRGFGFVEYTDPSSAEEAMRAMDGADLDGRNIQVTEARAREPRSGGGGPRSGGPRASRGASHGRR